MMVPLSSQILDIQRCLDTLNGSAILVGGYVRDALMGEVYSKDIDIEVYGCRDIEHIKKSLECLGPIHEVGRSFGVLKLDYEGYDFDISLPRTESKTGKGHKGFEVNLDELLSFEKAAKRRDFCMNAIGYDIKTQKLLDPYHGLEDIHNKMIRIVDKKSFQEDPLRVLRAVQFSARFGFSIEQETLSLCQEMLASKCLEELPKERIFEEIKKLLLRSKTPSIGFDNLDRMGGLFKEVKALQGVKQNPLYHPEGDVYIHTMMSIDVMAKENYEDNEKLILMMAVLCHDFGKPQTTKLIDGRIRAIGHETAGLEPTRSFVEALSDEKALLEAILPLVEHHLKPSIFFKDQSSDTAIRRLSTKVNIKRLIAVSQADFLGRTTESAKLGFYAAGKWLYEKSQALDVLSSKPKALLQGRHLLVEGLVAGLEFKEILEDAYNAQVSGDFCDESTAIAWFREYWKSKKKS